jgi:hypothetical protein
MGETMSKRDKGSRLEGKDLPCFFCESIGRHKGKIVAGKNQKVCKNCESLVKHINDEVDV